MRKSLSLGLLSILLVGLGVYYFTRTHHNMTRTGGLIVDVIQPELSDDEKVGEDLFSEYCSACHGQNAAGRHDVAPPLVHKIYEPGHHGDIAFQRAVFYGVRAHHWPFGNMPPINGVGEDDVTKITTYVRALQRENGIK